MEASTQHQTPPSRAKLQYNPDFKPYYDVIKELYITKNAELNAVMATMEKEHGFRATLKQYKVKLEAWGLKKNIRSREMRFIVRELESRGRNGKKTALVKVRRCHVSNEKIARWRRRNPPATTHSNDQLTHEAVSDVEFFTDDDAVDEADVPPPSAHTAEMDIDSGGPSCNSDNMTSTSMTQSRGESEDHRKQEQTPNDKGKRKCEKMSFISESILAFERAWKHIDCQPVPGPSDNEDEYLSTMNSLEGEEDSHTSDGSNNGWNLDLGQGLAISHQSLVRQLTLLDPSWGYPGQFPKAPDTSTAFSEEGSVASIDENNDDDDREYNDSENVNNNNDGDGDEGVSEDTQRDRYDLAKGSLYHAVMSSNVEEAEAALNEADELGHPFDNSALSILLALAASRGPPAVVSLLLKYINNYSTTQALRGAAETGRLEELQLLLEKGGYQPGALSFAVRSSIGDARKDICSLLLDRGADPNEVSSTGPEWGPPLLEAPKHNNSVAFKLLLDKGADLGLAIDISQARASPENDDDALDAAKALFLVLKEKDAKMATILVDKYAASVHDSLIIASKYGDKAVVESLLDMGANPSQLNHAGPTALMVARNMKVSELLLRHPEQPQSSISPSIASLRECRGLRFQFISQCRNMESAVESLPEQFAHEAELISQAFRDYRCAYSHAMSAVKELSRLQTPSDMNSPLAYLCLARAILDLIRSKTGVDYNDEFQKEVQSVLDLVRHCRWSSSLRYPRHDMSNYHLACKEVARLVWGVSAISQASSNHLYENVQHMRKLAGRHILEFVDLMSQDSLGTDELVPEDQGPPRTPSPMHVDTPMVKQPRYDPSDCSTYFPPDRFRDDSTNHSVDGYNGEPSNRPLDIPDRPIPSSSPSGDASNYPSPNLFKSGIGGNDGISTGIIGIAAGGLFAIVIVFIHELYQSSNRMDLWKTFGSTAIATQMSFAANQMLLSRPATPSMTQWFPNLDGAWSPSLPSAGVVDLLELDKMDIS